MQAWHAYEQARDDICAAHFGFDLSASSHMSGAAVIADVPVLLVVIGVVVVGGGGGSLIDLQIIGD